MNKAKPFLKWAGGKTQIINSLLRYIPEKYNNYIEPFVGGGALFFYLNNKESIISDLNEELVNTYKQVKSNVEGVINILHDFKNEEDFYYKIRSVDTSTVSDEYRAARIIYLNKTCFNGLYRVNKKNMFNVSYGKKSGKFFDENTLINASNFLQHAKIIHCDYRDSIKNAKSGDLVFLDPPYYPTGKYSDFKRYTKEFFYHEDHVILKSKFDELVENGWNVILTNSDNDFIIDLYSKYKIEILQTRRSINSKGGKRRGRDIIITNHKNNKSYVLF